MSNYKRGKDRKKRKQKMSKLGAGLRIGIAATTGAALLGGSAIPSLITAYKNKRFINSSKLAVAIGTVGGGATLGYAAYIDHRNSPYSPIGKKKWKPLPDKHSFKTYPLFKVDD